MKGIVDAVQFQKALSDVYKGAAPDSSLPALGTAKAEFTGSACILTCTNLDQWVQAEIPASGEAFSMLLGDTRQLLTACKHFKGDLELDFRAAEPAPPSYEAYSKRTSDWILYFRCGERSGKQLSMDAEDFPATPDWEAEKVYHTQIERIRSRYERIKYAVSDRSEKPIYQGIQFRDQRMVALDGYRLAYNCDDSLCVENGFVVPDMAMRFVSALKEGDCTLSVGGRYACFDTGERRVLTRLLEGEYLNIDQAIPSQMQETCVCSVSDFLNEVQYLQSFRKQADREPVVFARGTMSIETKGGEFSSFVPMQPCPQTVIGLNLCYLQDTLKQFQAKGAARITVKMSSRVSPVLFSDDAGDFAMILPVRLKSEKYLSQPAA